MKCTSFPTDLNTKCDTIAWYQSALLRLVAGMLGLLGDGHGLLCGVLKARVLRVLLPAEAAGRRLIVVMAQGVTVPSFKRSRGPMEKRTGTACEMRAPVFSLYDRRKYFCELSQNAPISVTCVARISFLDEERSVPVDAGGRPQTGMRLRRRIWALQRALEDLPKQAERLIRAMDRRVKGRASLRFAGPLRIGDPPGFRERQTHPIDGILAECDMMARRAQALDTG
jgi:hypothetical protein